eukprot:7870783-Pyramimonas_sp.AAC.1
MPFRRVLRLGSAKGEPQDGLIVEVKPLSPYGSHPEPSTLRECSSFRRRRAVAAVAAAAAWQHPRRAGGGPAAAGPR